MTKSDLPSLRLLANNNQITYTSHATQQMLKRGIMRDEVKAVLLSPTNQLIETQPPSKTPGKEHAEERALISDPCAKKDIVVVVIILFNPYPEVRVVTVEYAKDEVWSKNKSVDPWLVRK